MKKEILEELQAVISPLKEGLFLKGLEEMFHGNWFELVQRIRTVFNGLQSIYPNDLIAIEIAYTNNNVVFYFDGEDYFDEHYKAIVCPALCWN